MLLGFAAQTLENTLLESVLPVGSAPAVTTLIVRPPPPPPPLGGGTGQPARFKVCAGPVMVSVLAQQSGWLPPRWQALICHCEGVGETRLLSASQKETFLAQFAQHGPLLRKIAGKEKYEQDLDRFHRLERAEIYARVAARRAAAEKDQRERKRNRAEQRNKAISCCRRFSARRWPAPCLRLRCSAPGKTPRSPVRSPVRL